jgi:protein TonB
MYDREPFSPRPLRVAVGIALSLHLLIAVVGPPFLPQPLRLAHSLQPPPPEVVKIKEIVDLEPFPRPVLRPDAGVAPVDMPAIPTFEPSDEPDIELPLPPNMDAFRDAGDGAWRAGMMPSRGTAPAVLKRVEPRYPEMARRAGTEGEVELEALVNEAGRVVEVRVTDSTGSTILERAAEDAIRRWVFAPAKQGDKTVASWVRVRFVFDM